MTECRRQLNKTPTLTLRPALSTGNPLRCDCEIQWLRDWLGELRELHPLTARADTDLLREPICFYPQAMRGIPMLRTRENEFTCER